MAWADRWRTETHTFHLACGKIAPMLQDVAYLLDLSLWGGATGPAYQPIGALRSGCTMPEFRLIQSHTEGRHNDPHRTRLLHFQELS
jgi:hypothetical protein